MRTRNLAIALAATLIGVSAASLAQTESQKAAKAVSEQPRTTPQPASAMSGGSRAVATEDAPKAVGPYSQAVVAGGFLFASGQVNRDPKTGQVTTGTFEASAERVLDNLEAVLKADGLTWADVVKTTVYITRAEDFAALNTVYGKRMGDAKPARSTVVVAGLPGGAALEIDLVARARR